MKTIRLNHPHTHEGITYTPPPEGVELTVNDADAALLVAWGLTASPPTLDAASIAATDATIDRLVDAPDDAHDSDRVAADHEETSA
jgi:hypothetical protein